MFDIRNFEETLKTEYEETNDVYKVIRLAVQYIRNEIFCGNLVEESKFQWILEKFDLKSATELLNYISFLQDIRTDYHCLKSEILRVASLAKDLY